MKPLSNDPHELWHIHRDKEGELDKHLPIECGCGEFFAGFVAWGQHLELMRHIPDDSPAP